MPDDLTQYSPAQLVALIEAMLAQRPELAALIPPPDVVREPQVAYGTHDLVRGGTDALYDHLKPLIAQATDIAIVAAFVHDRGLALVQTALLSALDRGARVRLITGDYFNLTQASALQRLLDWQQSDTPRALSVRIIEIQRLQLPSFHPKSWRLERPGSGVAFVGSSNLSYTALTTGVEWNLRLSRQRRPLAYAELVEAFEALWIQATPITPVWLADYRERIQKNDVALPPGETAPDPPAPPIQPRQTQREALEALATSRLNGHRRALVVMATGLGKTFLAAFDVQFIAETLGRTPRVLILAHRAEILQQAADTFRRLMPGLTPSWCQGATADLTGTLVLAGVQKLSRPEHLATLRAQTFDYVIIDEVHHAAAQTWRTVIQALRTDFLLGLTATPERADGADILGLFDDHVAYRADLGEGIRRGALVPFRYFGLTDPTDYTPIPWRNGRFEPEQLATAIQTQARMAKLWAAWQQHPGSRTLVFCSTTGHANFARDWLAAKGLRVVSLHTGKGSADRAESLERLEQGSLDAICAVDLLNEGVDVKPVDRVVMLRPTASPVLFLQQLGRGLRTSPGKTDLVVLDFVGNHHTFLTRVRSLLSLSSRAVSLRGWLSDRESPTLPTGCTIDLEAKDLLHRLLPDSAENRAVEVYRELTLTRDQRPKAGELYRLGLSVRSLKGWFDFVQDEGHLTDAEHSAYATAREWLRRLERAPASDDVLTIIQSLYDQHILPAGPTPLTASSSTARHLLRQRSGTATLKLSWPKTEPGESALVELIGELLDLQAARRRQQAPAGKPGGSFIAKVIWNQRDPIIKLPSRKTREDLPHGDTDVRLSDSTMWTFRLMKEFINVARPVGSQRNQLPDLLREWFGPAAGHPGTRFQVRFLPTPDGWWAEPLDPLPDRFGRGTLTAFPSLEAAAGAGHAMVGAPRPEAVLLPGHWPGCFAVRVCGDSMDGGTSPMRDGDWVVLRWARSASLSAIGDRVALVTVGQPNAGVSHHLKRIGRTDDAFVLRSDNPTFPPMPVSGTTQVLALKQAVIRPEELAPAVGTVLDEADLCDAFSVPTLPDGLVVRTGGHLFFRISQSGVFSEPDRMTLPLVDHRPGECAYVLTSHSEGRWRYSGVGRWNGEQWCLPALDFATWRALGHGRSASRRLETRWREAAEELVQSMLRGDVPRWVEARGRRCRLVGEAARGGLRIDGGEGGFSVRTVSLTDLAWVLAARDRFAAHPLDEAAVNRLRYLEGTPKGSTRWIDTGWALVLTEPTE